MARMPYIAYLAEKANLKELAEEGGSTEMAQGVINAVEEMKKNKDELLARSHFKSFLKGRKEQAIRQVFYNDKFYDAVTISYTEVQDHFAMAGMTIQVNYLNLPDIKTIQKILELSQNNLS